MVNKQDNKLLQEIQHYYTNINNIDNLHTTIEKDIFRYTNEMISNKMYMNKHNNMNLQYQIYQLHIYKLFISFCDYLGYDYISDIPSDIKIYNHEYDMRFKELINLQNKCKDSSETIITLRKLICKL